MAFGITDIKYGVWNRMEACFRYRMKKKKKGNCNNLDFFFFLEKLQMRISDMKSQNCEIKIEM